MPQQFSVSDRETVESAAEEQTAVHDTSPIGPGLLVTYRVSHTGILGFDGLMRKYGWYVASYERNYDSSDVAVLMPVTEVPE